MPKPLKEKLLDVVADGIIGVLVILFFLALSAPLAAGFVWLVQNAHRF